MSCQSTDFFSFGLLCGHMVGDYVLQNGWMAKNKANGLLFFTAYDPDSDSTIFHQEMIGHLACTVHCFLYTLAVWTFSWQWMPWWGPLVCFLAHWPVDRFRLAYRWMVSTSWHKDFATGPLAPWSIIVVDNTIHLVALYLIAILAIT